MLVPVSDRLSYRPRLLALLLVLAWLAPASGATPAVEATPAGPLAGPVAQTIRLGVLRFGTVNWELDVIAHHGYARKRGLNIEVVPLASKSALSSALVNRQVDMIVGDWLWVSTQRHLGQRQTFVPYSMSVGSLVVGPGVRRIQDLRGRTIGIAGGPTDKSWLLLRAWARRTLDEDLEETTEQVFAPPPLLNELLLEGRLAAVLTNWNYAERLNAQGLRTLMPVADVLPALGIETPIPLLGWIFDERWAERNPALLAKFFESSYEAKARLAQSDEEWERLRPLLGVGDSSQLASLREVYRAGIPREFGEAHVRAAGNALRVLSAEAGRQLGIETSTLAGGTFWSGFSVPRGMATGLGDE